MKLDWLAGLIVVIAVAGCKKPNDIVVENAKSNPFSFGGTRVNSSNFSLEVPKGWKVYYVTSKDKLGKSIKGPDERLKLIATGPDGSTSDITVTQVVQTKELTSNELKATQDNVLRALLKPVHLPLGNCFRYEFESENEVAGGAPLTCIGYLLSKGKMVTSVTYKFLTTDKASVEKIASDTMQSFEIL